MLSINKINLLLYNMESEQDLGKDLNSPLFAMKVTDKDSRYGYPI